MPEAVKRRVLVLDDDLDFCDLLTILLESKHGVECLAVNRFRELVDRAAEVLTCDLAILDVNLGPGEPNGLDALAWLRSNAFRGAIVFLTGHARGHPLLSEQAESTGVRVLEKPVESRTLVSLLTAESTAGSSVAGGE